ncbi:hypothetical protein ABFS83_08G144600 [Erythranthe nasuta]
MAAPPMKSQPLHNFSLPTLRWAHKNSSSSSPAAAAAAGGGSSRCHRRRDSPDQLHETDSDNETQPPNPSQQTPDPVPAVAADEGNGEAKPWNLRPRKEAPAVKAASKSRKEARGECNESKINSINNGGVKSQRIRGMAAAAEGGQRNGGGERKIWISLSKEEIEEDIYAMTGGKPSRRPRKWPRNVQKQLDNVFPGLYLVGVAPDSYRVSML